MPRSLLSRKAFQRRHPDHVVADSPIRWCSDGEFFSDGYALVLNCCRTACHGQYCLDYWANRILFEIEADAVAVCMLLRDR
jgi:hypothetical protein